MVESFFGSLKKRRIKKQIYKTRLLAEADVRDYIEAFYNPSRQPPRWREPGAVRSGSPTNETGCPLNPGSSSHPSDNRSSLADAGNRPHRAAHYQPLTPTHLTPETALTHQIRDHLGLKHLFQFPVLQGLGAVKGIPDPSE